MVEHHTIDELSSAIAEKRRSLAHLDEMDAKCFGIEEVLKVEAVTAPARNALNEELRGLEASLLRLRCGLPAIETRAAEPSKPEPTPPVVPHQPPPLPTEISFEAVDGETPEAREDREMLREFFGDIRSSVAEALGAVPSARSFTNQRHFEITLALTTLRRWAREQRERADDLQARLEALEGQTADVLARGLFYAGVHQRALGYERGTMVTHKGSAWIAHLDAEPGEIPGECPAKWSLAIKKGRDGKDAPSVQRETASRRSEEATDAYDPD